LAGITVHSEQADDPEQVLYWFLLKRMHHLDAPAVSWPHSSANWVRDRAGVRTSVGHLDRVGGLWRLPVPVEPCLPGEKRNTIGGLSPVLESDQSVSRIACAISPPAAKPRASATYVAAIERFESTVSQPGVSRFGTTR
jgi:hypothetical protein